ncbi:MAG: acetyl-CoA C-acyltransferase [Promethearchaeota archaeon]
MVELNDVYIVEYVRTPFSRARPRKPERDVFGEIRGDHLCGYTIRNLFDEKLKGKVERDEVDEVLVGASLQIHENFLYGGRNPSMLGNMPPTIPAAGFDRQCGSAMTAMHHGIMSIMTGYADIIVASGFEHMTRVPMANNPHMAPPLELIQKGNQWYRGDVDIMTGFSMVQTAQRLFEEEFVTDDPITKEDMDKWAVRSHNLSAKAIDDGYFDGEIMPIMGHAEKEIETPKLIKYDQAIRRGSTLEGTASLRPVSRPHAHMGAMSAEKYMELFGTDQGMITAGNSSPLNAGSATCMLMSKKAMESHNLEPMAKVVSMGWGAVDPGVMGRGPVPASKMALKQGGLKVEDMEYWEINEAFNIVTLNCIKQLNIDPDIVNIYGGACAIGHPLGASGVRLPGTLARTLKINKAKYGLANLCCGGGQGVALILENTEV